MKILQVNKFFPFDDIRGNKKPDYHYPVGGTEALLLSIEKLLTANRHQVVYFSMKHPENLASQYSTFFSPYVNLHTTNGLGRKIRATGTVLYSIKARKQLAKLLDAYPVDMAHLHSIYHQLSPSLLDEFKKRSIPVVMTLHDFKMVCPSYNMLYKGKICEACRGKQFYHCILKTCHTGSLFKSMLVCMESYLHHSLLRTYGYVHHFICPSRFLMNKVREMGLKGTFHHLPNFLDYNRFIPVHTWRERSIVYFGRLIKIKGLITLFSAVKNIKQITLTVIGDGPLKEELVLKVKRENIGNITFSGYKKGEELQNEIKKAMFVLLPSEVYENNPYSILESFALGKPVIGSHIGGIPELCKENQTGLTFTPGDSKELQGKIEYLLSHPRKITEMGKNARKFIEETYNPGEYYGKLMEIYNKAIQR